MSILTRKERRRLKKNVKRGKVTEEDVQKIKKLIKKYGDRLTLEDKEYVEKKLNIE